MNALRTLCLTLCCLCGLFAPPGAHSAAAQQDGARPATAQEALRPEAARQDAALWRSIADGLGRNIALRRQELDHIRKQLPPAKAALAAVLTRMGSRLDQVTLLRGVAGETPWASRDRKSVV